MIAAGIAPSLSQLRERPALPSAELVFLAHQALETYRPARLLTCLTPGWEQALATAARELEIPYTVAIPFTNPAFSLHGQTRLLYLRLLHQAASQYSLAADGCQADWAPGLEWQFARADMVLALWEYEFTGPIFARMDTALRAGKTVVNLWEDWQTLIHMRRPAARPSGTGAQIYNSGA